jgi:hypothetical protein
VHLVSAEDALSWRARQRRCRHRDGAPEAIGCAVILQLVSDLTNGNAAQRSDAVRSLQDGTANAWLATLALSPRAHAAITTHLRTIAETAPAPPQSLSPEQVARADALTRDGATADAIAQTIGCSSATAWRARQALRQRDGEAG